MQGRLQRYRKPVSTIVFLFFGLIMFSIISVGTGPVHIPADEVFKLFLERAGFFSGASDNLQISAIVFGIRLPRVGMAILVGATLAIAGASLQGLFRNPLADPTLIGVSSGAAFAAACVIVLGGTIVQSLPEIISDSLLPVAAFLGGLIATLIVYSISTKNGRTSIATMLLAGIAINAIASAGIGYLIFTASDLQIRDLTFWTLGSIGGATWNAVYQTAPFLIISLIGLPLLSKSLNVLLLGEHEARYLGVDAEKVKKTIVVLASLGIGSAVAVSGVIGFVGLVVPHLIRLFIGPDHRFLMPASIFLGGLLLLASDLFARTVVAPAELPLGIVTATIGAPFFLWLLTRNKGVRNQL